MPQKSASSEVHPNTPGGEGQAPIQSGEGPATTVIGAVEQSRGVGVPGVIPPPAPVEGSPAAALIRDNQAKAEAEADPKGPKHCTVCGQALRGDIELATGPFDPETGEDENKQPETGGGPGNVAVLMCPSARHETWRRRKGGRWEREDTAVKAWGGDVRELEDRASEAKD